MENKAYKSTIDTLLATAVECNSCESACLVEEDVRMMVHCIGLNHDCARLCYLTAEYLASESQFMNDLLKLCAEVCETTANECEKHDYDHCRQCAEACRRCAEACRSLLAEATV